MTQVDCSEHTLGTILVCTLTRHEIEKFSDFNSGRVKCKIGTVKFKSVFALREVGEELSIFRRATKNYTRI